MKKVGRPRKNVERTPEEQAKHEKRLAKVNERYAKDPDKVREANQRKYAEKWAKIRKTPELPSVGTIHDGGADGSRMDTLHILHAAWLGFRAGIPDMEISDGLLGRPTLRQISELARAHRWSRAVEGTDAQECERRFREASDFVCLQVGQFPEILPEEIPMIGRTAAISVSGLTSQRRESLVPGGRLVNTDEIMGVPLPNPVATITRAEEAGVGPTRVMEEIQKMLRAESLVVETRIGYDKLPLPEGAKRDENGRVFMLGQWWDADRIIPNQEVRDKGVRLARDVLGVSDASVISSIAKRAKAFRDEVDGQWKDEERRDALAEKERQRQLTQVKEVGGKAKGGIMMVRPKEKTPQEWVDAEVSGAN